MMTPIGMEYSYLGLAYHDAVVVGQFLFEKSFDVLLATAGTLLGFWLAKRHIEDLVEKTITKMMNLNREMSFHRAVNAMLPELPQFYLRPSETLSPAVAGAIAEFTSWSTALNPKHTLKESMELIGTEAYRVAAELIGDDKGFKEQASVPNYEWMIEIGPLPVGFTVDEVPRLTIYNWDTGLPVYLHALMKETMLTDTKVCYSWKWDMKDVPCGLYAGAVNFTIGGSVKIQETAFPLGEMVRVFLMRDGRTLAKSHENVPW
jgi:hypothetical protein